MKRRALGCFLAASWTVGLLAGARAHAAAGLGSLVPMDPAGLLSLLPPPPPGWKLTTSRAAGEMSGDDSLQSYALRVYTAVAPASASPSAPPPPATVQLYLVDTAGDPLPFAFFRNQAGSVASHPGSKYKSLNLGGLFALEHPGDSFLTIRVEVSDRLLLAVKSTNMEPSALEDWLRGVNFAQMTQVSAAAPRIPLRSGTLALEHIDELNPKRDGKLNLSYVLPKDRVGLAPTR